ncbi:serine/arginine repetitive matrix protein 2 isoform X3 [Hermetia illucens]|uniref:serine/arginine repetitive matrix protein 2 isoform X3 n=1 Tax=Hermetia illucens TaxID=343691 RepID=UPI0018CC393C|nr:serine/arginine repetitive matrix protein 2 isoform X3 [Hermetia illucens]
MQTFLKNTNNTPSRRICPRFFIVLSFIPFFSQMDSDMSGPTATITMTSTRVSTVTMPSGSATPTRQRQQHDNNTSDSSNSKRPPPLQPVNVSVQVQSASVTVSGSDAQYSGVATLGVNTPSTPRIDISRASSSSHHEDSRDSSPDNVFEQVGTGTLQESIGLGFREEGAMDLRSSTEELYFMDPEQKKEEQEKLQQARKSPVIFKFDEHQTYLQQHQRKDSASSEVAALLCISGRTSRISSVGSQGSAVSRLSAISGISRSPSPHKMLLETSFCGPKPLENVVDGSIVSTVEPPTAEVLEQVLLSRKHDPTQAVFAEGIKIEGSPKRNLANGQTERKRLDQKDQPKTTKSTTSSRPVGKKVGIPTVGTRKDGSKRVVGALPSGAEYIRINLKPDYLYDDKGVAPNERVVEMSKSGGRTNEHRKPATLSIGRDVNAIEQRLTPSSSPKPSRHQTLARDTGGSRSPSPATVTVSRKSSFCSLFKPKDSPDSPRDQSRSRSKSRDRSTPQSQSGTPSKQKSVLAIFKPRRSVSKSKCSSPIDHDSATAPLDGISQVEFKFKSEPSSTKTESRSRPPSRLRYYDTPLDGKSIHIPLHTPPEEKQDRKFPPTSNESKEPEPPPPSASSSGSSHLTADPTPPTSATLPQVVSETSLPREQEEKPPALPMKAPKLAQLEKTQRIVNLDAIQSILSDDNSDRERTWSMEVQRHSSQESQETASIGSSNSTVTQRRISKTNLSDVAENPSIENGIPPEPKEQPVPNESMNHQNIPITKEKKRLLFATKIGSGSQEQIFSTQFSISKTESLSSQLSEQQSIPGSPNAENKHHNQLHRTDTVIRRPDDTQVPAVQQQAEESKPTGTTAAPVKRKPSAEDVNKPTVVGVIEKKDSSDEFKRKSKTSDEEDRRPMPAAVVMRKKDHSAESKRKSKSASEEDDSTNRHSRYIESFDVKKVLPELKAQSRNSSDSSIKERDSRTSSREDQECNTPIAAPQLPPKAPTSKERQSMMSTTDDLAESSESERDSEMDPNRIKRHLPRHIGAVEDHESTGLVSQDSFEDELPYVPTTLPEERAFGVSLIPMKDRANMEVKTCPVDRPRSTTPLNPACLEEYCGIAVPDDNEHVPIRGEKLRISLPRKDSIKDKSHRTKSPRRVSNSSGKTWFEFAEQGIGRVGPTTITTPTQSTTPNQADEEPPPPLPPRKPSMSSGQWINFENIPEKRKPPKRITALPKDSSLDFTSRPSVPNSQPVQYNYVKPEECQCECHEVERESHKSIANVDLLQQGEDMQPLLEPDSQEGIEPSDSSVEYSYENDEERPFQMDLSLGPHDSSCSNSHDPDSPESSRPILDDNTPTRSSSSSGRKKRSMDYQNP